MAECKPFDRLDHGCAQPALEQLRDAILAEYPGKVEVGSSGCGQITLRSAGRTTAYVDAPVTKTGRDRRIGCLWRIQWGDDSEDECFDTMYETLNAIRRRWGRCHSGNSQSAVPAPYSGT